MTKLFESAVQERRTFYGISKETVISDEKIKDIVTHAVTHAPSAFNSQSARVIVLLGEQHDQLWEITKKALRQVVSSDQFSATEEKVNSFKNGYGSVLYFEDQAVVQGLQSKFALYKDNFPIWSQQASGMLQFIIWTALEIEGFGVSLQHYSPLIDEEVKSAWNVPDTWKLIAQMPFGKPTVAPDEKQIQPLEERIQFF